ncbi:MAG TPA: hypothetical protein ENJ20_02165 [Bacteroidetes bacterium]|nr:hypothetical protein [Bacteroidota bacterium]
MKIEIDINNREKQLETCLVIATGLMVIWLISRKEEWIYAAVVIGVVGAFIPALAKWVHWLWYKIAEVMGGIMSRVLLSIVFFVFLFPIAVVYKLTNKDLLQLKRKKDTYWTKRDHRYSKKDLENAW